MVRSALGAGVTPSTPDHSPSSLQLETQSVTVITRVPTRPFQAVSPKQSDDGARRLLRSAAADPQPVGRINV